VDESFVAKLLDVGTEVELEEGHVLVDPDEPSDTLFLIRHGAVEVEAGGGDAIQLGAGHVVSARTLAERYGLDDARAVAATPVRAVAVDAAAYEAAVSG
jgi:CRP-like cAMP-binding protein